MRRQYLRLLGDRETTNIIAFKGHFVSVLDMGYIKKKMLLPQGKKNFKTKLTILCKNCIIKNAFKIIAFVSYYRLPEDCSCFFKAWEIIPLVDNMFYHV